jgi:hypothetical protein
VQVCFVGRIMPGKVVFMGKTMSGDHVSVLGKIFR